MAAVGEWWGPAGFADFVTVPLARLVRLAPGVSFELGALVELLACALRAVSVARVEPGDDVLVLGCDAGGLLHVVAARSRGARVLAVDAVASRRARALEEGAAEALDAGDSDLLARVSGFTDGGPAVSIVGDVDARLIDMALRAIPPGGRVVAPTAVYPAPEVALAWNRMRHDDVRLVGVHAPTAEDHRRAAALVSKRLVHLDRFVGRVYPIREVEAAFACAGDGDTTFVLIATDWGGSPASDARSEQSMEGVAG
jgi:threonine dehydrogenase-like Zn-dependent dehydrogenase